MDRVPSYDEDILAWSEHQAALLRALKPGAGLPNDLDLENIAEEVEAVGRSELAAVESHLFNLLVHAAKALSPPQASPVRHWLEEMSLAQQGALRSVAPSMRRRLDLQGLWRRAVRQAERSLRLHGEAIAPLPATCPFTLDELLDESLEPEAYVARLQPPATG
ncbi:DUF29 domain-containing protein [Roseicella aquatilis]|uniref:DUF29 domain-containing protein n=1 Tax=Roseicella aquatilis TaxID=2527868 RepID=A0A4R4DSF6_9PROT|nr:DUF29 domain-containing protein [Roseicella aquatilis]TCZ65529.1 DUF29 domain-containing protein [Roseicella aquatilis]